MVEISPAITMVINLAAFAAFVTIGGVLLYLGRSMNLEKKITMPWVNLSFGTFLIGINYLIQSFFTTQVYSGPVAAMTSYLLVIGGIALSFTSFIILYVDRSNEAMLLKKRQGELEEITKRLRDKFLRRELAEEELRKLDTDIVRELAEIEVKLDKIHKGRAILKAKKKKSKS